MNLIIDTIFEKYPNGMFFDEFTQFCKEISSELFVAIFDPLYEYVPCIQNYMILRANYQKLLTQDLAWKLQVQPNHSFIELPPPLSTKQLEKVTNYT